MRKRKGELEREEGERKRDRKGEGSRAGKRGR